MVGPSYRGTRSKKNNSVEKGDLEWVEYFNSQGGSSRPNEVGWREAIVKKFSKESGEK
jgi:hypothetical protein